jgi:L-serine/L-threonine ammonia-lyase
VPATIVVPQTTAADVRERMRALGAEVIAHGAVWDVAHTHALALAAKRGADYVHPFDHPIVWRGNATMVHELAQDLPHAPEVIVLAVGGGGLFCGVMQGLQEVGWHATRVVAAETEGAASLAAALNAHALVELPAITSIATTLGARKVAAQAYAYARESKVSSVVVSDRAAVEACLRFADDQRTLVEPACGAALAVLYGEHPALAQARDIAVIVCGGIGVTHAKLTEWQRILP